MKFLAIAFLLLSTSAFAQQQPSDPAFMQKAISALQAQRNAAQDAAASAEARLAQLMDDFGNLRTELAKAKADLEAAKKPAEPAK